MKNVVKNEVDQNLWDILKERLGNSFVIIFILVFIKFNFLNFVEISFLSDFEKVKEKILEIFLSYTKLDFWILFLCIFCLYYFSIAAGKFFVYLKHLVESGMEILTEKRRFIPIKDLGNLQDHVKHLKSKLKAKEDDYKKLEHENIQNFEYFLHNYLNFHSGTTYFIYKTDRLTLFHPFIFENSTYEISSKKISDYNKTFESICMPISDLRPGVMLIVELNQGLLNDNSFWVHNNHSNKFHYKDEFGNFKIISEGITIYNDGGTWKLEKSESIPCLVAKKEANGIYIKGRI